MIDGLSRFGALIRIVLPLSAPGIAAVRHLHLHRGLERAAVRARPHHLGQPAHCAAGPQLPHHQRRAPWGPLMAGAVISSVPLMVLYFVAQRFMVAGMTEGSVKG